MSSPFCYSHTLESGFIELEISPCKSCSGPICPKCITDNFPNKILCISCYNTRFQSNYLKSLKYYLVRAESRVHSLTALNEKSSIKLHNKLNKCENVSLKISEFEERVKHSIVALENHKLHLLEEQEKSKLTIERLNLELGESKSFLRAIIKEEEQLEEESKKSASKSSEIKRKIVALRNKLAELQDESFEKIRMIEKTKNEIADLQTLTKQKKDGRVRSMIEEDIEKLELIVEENQKMNELIIITEESSRTDSVVTNEEMSTNHEDEENIKELALKVQEQLVSICKMKLVLEKTHQDLENRPCVCEIF